MAEKHVDGLTGQVFNSEQEYLDHVSPVTGYKPTDLQHQGTRGILVAKAALKRTNSLNKTRETALDKQLYEAKAGDVNDKLMRAKLR